MKLLIHDLDKTSFANLIGEVDQGVVVIDNSKKIINCVGCFGCWVKTPATCVMKDSFMDMGKLIAQCDDIIIISECVYGGYSPFVKNVLDRSISYVLPYFTIRKGEMHHKSRYLKQGNFSAYFYGKEVSEEEIDTAQNLVHGNALNLNMFLKNFFVVKNIEDLKGELKWIYY